MKEQHTACIATCHSITVLRFDAAVSSATNYCSKQAPRTTVCRRACGYVSFEATSSVCVCVQGKIVLCQFYRLKFELKEDVPLFLPEDNGVN